MNFNLKLFNTTETELKAIAALASIGFNSSPFIGNKRSQWNTDYIIYKCPKQVLINQADCLFGQTDRTGKQQQVGRDKRNHSHIHCNISSFSHRDADIGPCKRLRVLNAIADHRHFLTLLL